jgi:hypothetical protein
MRIADRFQRVPWVPILLFILVLVSWANWRATTRLEAVQRRLGLLNEVNDNLEEEIGLLRDANDHLAEIEDNTDCLRPVAFRPIGCR